MNINNEAHGIGSLMVAGGVAMIADHLGMPSWKIVVVIILIGTGLPAAITGRLRIW